MPEQSKQERLQAVVEFAKAQGFPLAIELYWPERNPEVPAIDPIDDTPEGDVTTYGIGVDLGVKVSAAWVRDADDRARVSVCDTPEEAEATVEMWRKEFANATD